MRTIRTSIVSVLWTQSEQVLSVCYRNNQNEFWQYVMGTIKTGIVSVMRTIRINIVSVLWEQAELVFSCVMGKIRTSIVSVLWEQSELVLSVCYGNNQTHCVCFVNSHKRYYTMSVCYGNNQNIYCQWDYGNKQNKYHQCVMGTIRINIFSML